MVDNFPPKVLDRNTQKEGLFLRKAEPLDFISSRK